MLSLPGNIDGDTYNYIMSAIDIFSRFLFLRLLQTKETSEEAEHLLDIYKDHGPPGILQSDQGWLAYYISQSEFNFSIATAIK